MTQYALVEDDTLVTYGPLPTTWYDGERYWDLRGKTDPELATLGWLPVVETPRPPDTETDTTDYLVVLVDGLPTEVWEPRPKTPAEVDAATRAANSTELVDDSGEAIPTLEAVVANLNAMTDMTNAEVNANPAAVIKDLARECKTIARQAIREARLTSGELDSASTGPPDTVP